MFNMHDVHRKCLSFFFFFFYFICPYSPCFSLTHFACVCVCVCMCMLFLCLYFFLRFCFTVNLIWAVHWCDVLIVYIYISNEYITFYFIFKVCKTKQNYSENKRDKHINFETKRTLKQYRVVYTVYASSSVCISIYVQYSVILFAFKFVCLWLGKVDGCALHTVYTLVRLRLLE